MPPFQNLGRSPQNTLLVQDAAQASHSRTKEYVTYKKRSVNLHVDTVIDAIVKTNTNMIVKALLKLKLHLCSDINAKVKVLATGFLTAGADSGGGNQNRCSCRRVHAKDIVADDEALVKADIEHLFIAFKFSLMTHVRAHVAAVVRDLGVNLLL
ncbi:hypothetical protein BGZ80_001000 [Entomortierella chlamydospora]|uniref:Uncharacterized protein n=1 Tax=Entomortierella chlamydospora TaxID=101097 RepID=A0A9P6N3F9_9FUNG|nr:hypothetical protein BGZ79_001210 [Entomortierella chlamydospora]KAG0022131.1 hypothetical protein BGZ80_001000 [Entomortierella chlamydospora]